MARRAGRLYIKAFFSGFVVTVTALDRLAYVSHVKGASMQPSLNPDAASVSDVVLLYRWGVGNHEIQRGEIVAVVSPRNPKETIIKRVIGLEGDFIRTLSYKNRFVCVPDGHFWIEGDNHGVSMDSNSFGPVPVSLLDGRASYIIWPPNRWQRIVPAMPQNRAPLSPDDDED